MDAEGIDLNTIIMAIMAVAVVVGFGIFLIPASNSQKDIHRRALKLMASYSNSASAEEKISSLRKQDSDPLITKIFAGLPTLKNVREKVERLDEDYSLKDFAVRMVISFLLSFIILHVMMGMNLILALVLCLFFSYFLPNMGLNRRLAKRNQQFLKLMPDALDLIIRGLRSGLPVTESMHSIVQEIAEPVKSVFMGISSAIKVGMSFEQALYETAKKLDLNEFNFFAISIALQRETGGNLAEILENLSETIRARAMMKLKIRAISSEARASSYIVGALPFVVVAALSFTSPDYLDPLFSELSGNIAIAIASAMFVFGMWVMNRMAKMEV